ncbi:MAG: Ig-like domain-containing protein [Bacteroidales bacterium]|nr:Ig-like domain-containing protein [Bacteroidales bacterium]
MKVNKIYYLLIIASFAIISACDKEGKQVVTGISISKKSFLLTAGEIEGVWITFEPNGSTDKVTWVSSDNEIATVSESAYMPSKAKIKAIGPGHAVISALVGDLKTECSVSVADVYERIGTGGLSSADYRLSDGQDTIAATPDKRKRRGFGARFDRSRDTGTEYSGKPGQ